MFKIFTVIFLTCFVLVDSYVSSSSRYLFEHGQYTDGYHWKGYYKGWQPQQFFIEVVSNILPHSDFKYSEFCLENAFGGHTTAPLNWKTICPNANLSGEYYDFPTCDMWLVELNGEATIDVTFEQGDQYDMSFLRVYPIHGVSSDIRIYVNGVEKDWLNDVYPMGTYIEYELMPEDSGDSYPYSFKFVFQSGFTWHGKEVAGVRRIDFIPGHGVCPYPPNQCYGNQCVLGRCECPEGHYGLDCSIPVMHEGQNNRAAPSCYRTNLLSSGYVYMPRPDNARYLYMVFEEILGARTTTYGDFHFAEIKSVDEFDNMTPCVCHAGQKEGYKNPFMQCTLDSTYSSGCPRGSTLTGNDRHYTSLVQDMLERSYLVDINEADVSGILSGVSFTCDSSGENQVDHFSHYSRFLQNTPIQLTACEDHQLPSSAKNKVLIISGSNIAGIDVVCGDFRFDVKSYFLSGVYKEFCRIPLLTKSSCKLNICPENLHQVAVAVLDVSTDLIVEKINRSRGNGVVESFNFDYSSIPQPSGIVLDISQGCILKFNVRECHEGLSNNLQCNFYYQVTNGGTPFSSKHVKILETHNKGDSFTISLTSQYHRKPPFVVMIEPSGHFSATLDVTFYADLVRPMTIFKKSVFPSESKPLLLSLYVWAVIIGVVAGIFLGYIFALLSFLARLLQRKENESKIVQSDSVKEIVTEFSLGLAYGLVPFIEWYWLAKLYEFLSEKIYSMKESSDVRKERKKRRYLTAYFPGSAFGLIPKVILFALVVFFILTLIKDNNFFVDWYGKPVAFSCCDYAANPDDVHDSKGFHYILGYYCHLGDASSNGCLFGDITKIKWIWPNAYFVCCFVLVVVMFFVVLLTCVFGVAFGGHYSIIILEELARTWIKNRGSESERLID